LPAPAPVLGVASAAAAGADASGDSSWPSLGSPRGAVEGLDLMTCELPRRLQIRSRIISPGYEVPMKTPTRRRRRVDAAPLTPSRRGRIYSGPAVTRQGWVACLRATSGSIG
jgi:hypothetical protein